MLGDGSLPSIPVACKIRIKEAGCMRAETTHWWWRRGVWSSGCVVPSLYSFCDRFSYKVVPAYCPVFRRGFPSRVRETSAVSIASWSWSLFAITSMRWFSCLRWGRRNRSNNNALPSCVPAQNIQLKKRSTSAEQRHMFGWTWWKCWWHCCFFLTPFFWQVVWFELFYWAASSYVWNALVAESAHECCMPNSICGNGRTCDKHVSRARIVRLINLSRGSQRRIERRDLARMGCRILLLKVTPRYKLGRSIAHCAKFYPRTHFKLLSTKICRAKILPTRSPNLSYCCLESIMFWNQFAL